MASTRNNNPSSASASGASGARPTRRARRGRASMPPRPSSGRARHASQRRSVGAEAPRATASAARRVARGNLARQTNLMKYAADNRLVRAVYHFTTAYKPLFIALVAVAVAIGVYFPVRDLYIAQRTESILQQQLEIRKKYNNSLSKEVKKYLSQEGIEDTARKELGMVMPGEKTITVQGLDDDGTDSDGSSSVTGTESDEDGETLKGADAADRDKTGSASAPRAIRRMIRRPPPRLRRWSAPCWKNRPGIGSCSTSCSSSTGRTAWPWCPRGRRANK